MRSSPPTLAALCGPLSPLAPPDEAQPSSQNHRPSTLNFEGPANANRMPPLVPYVWRPRLTNTPLRVQCPYELLGSERNDPLRTPPCWWEGILSYNFKLYIFSSNRVALTIVSMLQLVTDFVRAVRMHHWFLRLALCSIIPHQTSPLPKIRVSKQPVSWMLSDEGCYP